MKNLFLLLTVFLLSCQSEDHYDEFTTSEEFIARASSDSITISLEDAEYALLKNGERVALPWKETSSTTILDEVRLDVEESEGWKVLYTTVEIEGYNTPVSEADSGVNYMLLYNKYRGLLKGFYYVESINNVNNTSLWLLSTQEKTSMFNFVPYFALPKNSPDSPQQVSLSNITNDGLSQGFQHGWNCFMTELSYDEGSKNKHLNVSGYAMNQSTFTFTGAFKSSSSGTIVSSTSSSSNIIKGVANVVGKTGKNWIISNSGDSTNKVIKFSSDVIGSVLENGISGLVSTGLSKIFGSLNGTANQVSTLQFSTNGTIEIEGSSYTVMSGYIWPLSGIPLGGLGEDLGAWCLETTPVYTADAYVKLKEAQRTPNYFRNIYTVKFTPSYNVKKNPALGYFSCGVKPVLYDISQWGPGAMWNGAYGNTEVYATRETDPTVLYEDSVTKICDTPLSYDIVTIDLLPTKTSSSNIPYADISTSKYNVRENIAIQFTSSFLNNGKFLYSIKTFIPEQVFTNNVSGLRPYNWTYSDLESAGYVK